MVICLKMEKMRVLGLSLLVFGLLGVKAQESVIGIASDITILCECDSVEVGDTVMYKYSIENTGDGAMTVAYPFWNGNGYSFFPTYDHKIEVTNENFPSNPVSYSFLNDDETGVSMTIHDPETKVQLDYVYPGDTAVVYIEDIVMPARHKEGNNTIVVWPENINGVTMDDSLDFKIKVVSDSNGPDASSSVEPWLINSKIYPNPTSGFLYIQGVSKNVSDIQRIFVRDLKGKVVKVFGGVYEQYDVSDIASGHYTLSFELVDKSVYAKPLIIKK